MGGCANLAYWQAAIILCQDPINGYTQAELRSVVKWIESDGRLRTEDDLIRDVMHFLGFRKRGSRILVAIREAMKP